MSFVQRRSGEGIQQAYKNVVLQLDRRRVRLAVYYYCTSTEAAWDALTGLPEGKSVDQHWFRHREP